MRKLPREAPAGTRWLYSAGETNLVGTLVKQATNKPLASYLAAKIWSPVGMEQEATWILSKTGKEIGGCCIQASARDFARMGLFILNGARVNHHLPQKALGHEAPVQALKAWKMKAPDLFVKNVLNHPRPDNYL